MASSPWKLVEIRALCDEFGAMLVVDDSHGHGVMAKPVAAPMSTVDCARIRSTFSPGLLGRRWVVALVALWPVRKPRSIFWSSGLAPHCSPMPYQPPWRRAPRWRSKFCRKSLSGLSVFAPTLNGPDSIRDAGFEVWRAQPPFVPSLWVIPPGPFAFRSGCLRRVFL